MDHPHSRDPIVRFVDRFYLHPLSVLTAFVVRQRILNGMEFDVGISLEMYFPCEEADGVASLQRSMVCPTVEDNFRCAVEVKLIVRPNESN